MLRQVTDIMEAKALQVAPAPMSQRRVLAFSPDALPLRLDTEAEVRAALMGLAQVRAPELATPRPLPGVTDCACPDHHRSSTQDSCSV